jgi:hypothetical protein
MSLLRDHLLRRHVGTIIVPLAVLLVMAATASSAHAACGDYLHVGKNNHAASNSPVAPLPCHGPNCSGSHAIPPIAPATPSPNPRSDAVTSSARELPPTVPSSFGRSVSEVLPPADGLDPIYHPPR